MTPRGGIEALEGEDLGLVVEDAELLAPVAVDQVQDVEDVGDELDVLARDRRNVPCYAQIQTVLPRIAAGVPVCDPSLLLLQAGVLRDQSVELGLVLRAVPKKLARVGRDERAVVAVAAVAVHVAVDERRVGEARHAPVDSRDLEAARREPETAQDDRVGAVEVRVAPRPVVGVADFAEEVGEPGRRRLEDGRRRDAAGVGRVVLGLGPAVGGPRRPLIRKALFELEGRTVRPRVGDVLHDERVVEVTRYAHVTEARLTAASRDLVHRGQHRTATVGGELLRQQVEVGVVEVAVLEVRLQIHADAKVVTQQAVVAQVELPRTRPFHVWVDGVHVGREGEPFSTGNVAAAGEGRALPTQDRDDRRAGLG